VHRTLSSQHMKITGKEYRGVFGKVILKTKVHDNLVLSDTSKFLVLQLTSDKNVKKKARCKSNLGKQLFKAIFMIYSFPFQKNTMLKSGRNIFAPKWTTLTRVRWGRVRVHCGAKSTAWVSCG